MSSHSWNFLLKFDNKYTDFNYSLGYVCPPKIFILAQLIKNEYLKPTTIGSCSILIANYACVLLKLAPLLLYRIYSFSSLEHRQHATDMFKSSL